MSKSDQVQSLLKQISERLDDLFRFEKQTGMDISPEEMIIAAVESVLNEGANSIPPVIPSMVALPVGRVDKDNMSFYLDDEHYVPIYDKEGIYGED